MPYTTVLDFGSLKLKLSIFENNVIIKQVSYLTLLGKDLNQNNQISDKAYNLLDEALVQAKQVIHQYSNNKLHLIGTEALRQIENIDKVNNLVNQHLGNINIQIINQEQEANYLFEAISSCFELSIAVCDIGGGSVQLMQGQDNIVSKTLLKTGTYKLQQEFSPNNNIISDKLNQAIAIVGQEVLKINFESEILIFGTTCMQDFIIACNKVVNLNLNYTKPHLNHKFFVTVVDLERLYDELIKFTPDSRELFYPEGGYFIYGADYLLINVIQIAKRLKAKYIYPTNYNTSYAFGK